MRTYSASDLEISEIDVWPVAIPLKEDFTISQGSVSVAENIFVRVRLHNGVVGYGESAPFPELTGESQAETLQVLDKLRPTVRGSSVEDYRNTGRSMSLAFPRNPAARCGLEIAMIDAFSRTLGAPLGKLFGQETTKPQETDITLPILGKDKCVSLAEYWYQRGFRILKVKVGKDLDADLATIVEIANRLPEVSFVVDANQGFIESDALALIKSLGASRVNVRILEQPVSKDDIEALARLKNDSPFPICADESVATLTDAANVCRNRAADVINIKIMKSGVSDALDIAQYVLGAGLDIMFGGMLETRLAMGCSLAMAAGLDPVHTLDLDTPLLMAEDPWNGGYRYEGPTMHLSKEPGLGMIPKANAGPTS